VTNLQATQLPVPIPASRALGEAESDALRAYRDLSPFRVEVRLEDDGWHIDYELKDPQLQGGGPHYVIDATDGRIVRKRYEQ
jgi:hypothetical protein